MESEPNSVGTIVRVFHERLKNEHHRNEINQFLYILFNDWKGWSRAHFMSGHGEILSDKEVKRFLSALNQLENHKPVQYITGVAHFLDIKLEVNSDVLIPRPETEELTDLVIKENSGRKNDEINFLDIGTGSGCIAISIKKRFLNSSVYAMDNSANALKVAGRNAASHGLHLNFIHFDILQKAEKKELPGYDIIITNPPYVCESEIKDMNKNVLDYEPGIALFVPDSDPLVFYKAIADFAIIHLSRPGLLYLEINEMFGSAVSDLLLSKKFSRAEIIKDLNGKDRFIRAEWGSPEGSSGSHY
jgi:release factor glutamine methyltransferase